jgi:hypothetical protein
MMLPDTLGAIESVVPPPARVTGADGDGEVWDKGAALREAGRIVVAIRASVIARPRLVRLVVDRAILPRCCDIFVRNAKTQRLKVVVGDRSYSPKPSI